MRKFIMLSNKTISLHRFYQQCNESNGYSNSCVMIYIANKKNWNRKYKQRNQMAASSSSSTTVSSSSATISSLTVDSSNELS